MKRLLACVFVVAAMLGTSAAYAVQPDEIMADPAKETRARDLSRELRCMVCQNQSIDDSDAPLARDLRLLVRERIGAGDSDSQVIDFLVARYGEFVLLKPRFTPHTLLLWLLPPLALAGGGLALWIFSRRRSKSSGANDPSLLKLSEEEEARLERLIAAEFAAGKEGIIIPVTLPKPLAASGRSAASVPPYSEHATFRRPCRRKSGPSQFPTIPPAFPLRRCH